MGEIVYFSHRKKPNRHKDMLLFYDILVLSRQCAVTFNLIVILISNS